MLPGVRGSQRSLQTLGSALQWETAILWRGWWPLLPWTVKKKETHEERGKKKKAVIYYSNEMKSGRWWKRGRVLAAENLLLCTSVISLRPWQNNKFKGNQPSWRISLPYFQWGTLEVEKRESRVYPEQDLINSLCVHRIWQVSLVPTLHNKWTKTWSKT